MTRSEATHATSGFHGSRMRLSASGVARMSGSAGVMSYQTAKPAKPAPDFATASIALAGTSFARMVPNRSTKEIRKYLIPCFLAISPHDGIELSPLRPSPLPACGERSDREAIRVRGRLRKSERLEAPPHPVRGFAAHHPLPASGERELTSHPRNPVGARERDAGHGGGLHGQRDQVLGLEIVQVRLAAGARDGLRFERHDRQVIGKLAAGD